MVTATMDMRARMVEWRHRKVQREQPGTETQTAAAHRKREAWEIWRKRASYEDLTLREIVDGPKTRVWTAEQEARERQLFEEFWAEEMA